MSLATKQSNATKNTENKLQNICRKILDFRVGRKPNFELFDRQIYLFQHKDLIKNSEFTLESLTSNTSILETSTRNLLNQNFVS